MRETVCGRYNIRELGHFGFMPASVSCLIPVDAVTEKTLGIDGIEVQLLAQFFAQLADVALNHILFDILIKDSVNRTENLGL